MEKYQNLSGKSGVSAFEIGDDNIKIQFSDYSMYLYTYSSAGRENIETMKMLAKSGKGLNSYISRVVKKLYASKL